MYCTVSYAVGFLTFSDTNRYFHVAYLSYCRRCGECSSSLYCDDFLLKLLWEWTGSVGEILNWDVWISKTKILQITWGL